MPKVAATYGLSHKPLERAQVLLAYGYSSEAEAVQIARVAYAARKPLRIPDDNESDSDVELHNLA